MRWLGLAALYALLPSVGFAQRPPELDKAFSDPEVSLVALVIHRTGCDHCVAALPGWRRFVSEHRKQGLRVFAFVEDKSGRCAPPPMKVDGLICDDRGSHARALELSPEHEAILYTYGATRPDAVGASASVQKAALEWMKARPRLDFEIRGDRNFAEAFRAELAAMTRAKMREGATGAIAVDTPCGRSSLPDALWLRVEQTREGASWMLAPKGGVCLLDRRDVDFDARRARASAADAARDILPPWPVASMVAAPPPPPSGPTLSAKQAAAQGSLAEGLRAFAERWKGTRHRHGADGLGADGIDGPHFVDRAYQEVLGRSIGTTLNDIYAIPGESIQVTLTDPERGLRPGDLLFFTTHADEPRQVMLYLGGGEVAQSVEVRGVVIDPIPRSLPDMFWLIGRRPQPD